MPPAPLHSDLFCYLWDQQQTPLVFQLTFHCPRWLDCLPNNETVPKNSKILAPAARSPRQVGYGSVYQDLPSL